MPHERGKLSGRCNGSDLLTFLCLDPLEERAKWAGSGSDGPYGFDQHGPSMASALLCDAPMERGMIARLAYARIETEVADELLRRGEARNVAHRRENACRHDRIHATDRHQSTNIRILHGLCGHCALDGGQLGGQSVVLEQMSGNDPFLVFRQRRLLKPCTSSLGKQLAFVPRDQISVQYRLHMILESRELPDKLRPFGDHPPLAFRLRVCHPHFWQEAAGVEFGEHASIDLVGLDLRMRDRSHLQWIGDHDASNIGRQQLDQNRSVPRLLQDDVVFFFQALGREFKDRLPIHSNLSSVTDAPGLEDGDLSEAPVHVQPDNFHTPTSLRTAQYFGSGGSHDNYGFALAAQPGESRGRPDNNASSQLIVNCGLPAIRAPDTPCPAARRYPVGTMTAWARSSGNSMPDNNAAERALRAVALGRNYPRVAIMRGSPVRPDGTSDLSGDFPQHLH